MWVEVVKSIALMARALHRRGDGQRVRSGDPERAPQALVAVAQGGFDDLDIGHLTLPKRGFYLFWGFSFTLKSLTPPLEKRGGGLALPLNRTRTSGWPSSTALLFSASSATTVPFLVARIGFISFITSMILITLSSSTASPGCTNGGSPPRSAAGKLPSSGARDVHLSDPRRARFLAERRRVIGVVLGARPGQVRGLLLGAPGPPAAVAPDAQTELAHLQVERGELRGIEQPGDLGDVLAGQAHLLPRTCSSGGSADCLSPRQRAASLADHTVSGRLCSRNT